MRGKGGEERRGGETRRGKKEDRQIGLGWERGTVRKKSVRRRKGEEREENV